MVGGMDRALGLASIGVGLLATVVLGIAVSATTGSTTFDSFNDQVFTPSDQCSSLSW